MQINMSVCVAITHLTATVQHQHGARGGLCWWFTMQFHLHEGRRSPYIWYDSSKQHKEELSRFYYHLPVFLQEKAFYLAHLQHLCFIYKCPFYTWGVRGFYQEMEDADERSL